METSGDKQDVHMRRKFCLLEEVSSVLSSDGPRKLFDDAWLGKVAGLQ